MAKRRLTIGAWRQIGIVAVIATLSLSGGGYAGVALGAATVLAWILIVILILGGRSLTGRVGSDTIAAGLCLLALAALSAFSLLWARDDGTGFFDVVRVVGYAGGFVLAALLFGSSSPESVLKGIAGGIFVVSLIALGSRLGGVGGGDAGLVSAIASTGGRLSYPIGYWNALGAIMAIGIPLFVWMAAERPGRRPPGWTLAAIAPLLLVAYMTSSRGSLLAAVLGTAVVVALARSRRRASAAFGVAIVGALPAVVAATLIDGILDGPGDGTPGASELTVVLALIAGMAFAALVGGRLAVRLVRVRPRRFRIRPRLLIGVAVGVAIGAIGLSGPSRFVDDFRSVPVKSRTETGSSILSASGSGRAQFWGTALEAFADSPVKGIGAGGFGTYWSMNGSLDTPARNAHSEPLELLAELGPLGLGCFVAFFFFVVRSGLRRVSGSDRATRGAALGVIAAASVGFLIDWTWQIPAVVVPVLIAAALLASPTAGGGTPASSRQRLARGPLEWRPAIVAAGLIALAIPALWAGGVLATATSRLDASRQALDGGEYGAAAEAARSAASIEPWAAEPWLQLAAAERGADNFAAGSGAAAAAIDRAPDDFRSWVLAALLHIDEGDYRGALAYTRRASLLAPNVLSRVFNLGLSAPGNGI